MTKRKIKTEENSDSNSDRTSNKRGNFALHDNVFEEIIIIDDSDIEELSLETLNKKGNLTSRDDIFEEMIILDESGTEESSSEENLLESIICAIREGDFDKFLAIMHLIKDIKSLADTHFLVHEAASVRDNNFLSFLLSKGADVNKIDDEGKDTALHIAVYHKDIEKVKKLLQEDAKIDTYNRSKQSPFHVALIHNYLTIAELLLEKAISNGAYPKKGVEDLCCAIRNKHIKIVEKLIESSVDLFATDDSNNTPIFYALESESTDVIECIFQKRDIYEIQNWVNNNKGLLSIEHDTGILHIPASKGNVKMVEFLVKNGVSAEDTNQKKETALHEASKGGHVKVMQYLFNRAKEEREHVLNSFINATDENGNTALHIGTKQFSIESVRWLLNAGANPNRTNQYGETPLHCALRNYEWGNLSTIQKESAYRVVELLLTNKALPNIPNDFGKTPIDMAKSLKDEQLSRLFNISYKPPSATQQISFVQQLSPRDNDISHVQKYSALDAFRPSGQNR